MWNEFIQLFTQMSPIAAICLIVGLILAIIEIFQPGIGIFGTLGAILLVVGVVIRMAAGGTFQQLFYMVFCIVLILVATFLLMIRMARMGWLTKTALSLKRKNTQDVSQSSSDQNSDEEK